MAENVYNLFNTREKWEHVNQTNKNIINDYSKELQSRGKSQGTIKQYLHDLKIFACYILTNLNNVTFGEISKKDIRNFVLHLQDRKQSSARVNRILSSIRTMYDYVVDDEDYQDIVKSNPAEKIKGVQNEKVRKIEFLTMKDIDIIYNRLIKDGEYQQALLLALLVDSAGRRNEVYQVEKWTITDKGNFTNEVVGKGGKRFKLMYHKLTKDTFKMYIHQRGDDDEQFLWYKRDKGQIVPIESQTLYNWVKRWNNIYFAETGIETNFTIHSFRHTVLELLSTGEHYLCDLLGVTAFSLDTLQVLAHHNDMATTSSYLKDRSDDILLKAFMIE